MAIYHCSMKPVARSGGRSAVAAIAYRTASRIVNERDGLVHDFTRKTGVVHTEIVLPEGIDARWALDRSVLWNAAEFAEKRRDARLAREFEIALPHELNADQQLALVRAFAHDLADRHGAAVDFAIHVPRGESDIRNIHAHVMMTTRTVGPDGLGEKTLIERENKWLLNHDLPTSQMQLREIRQAWETHANRALMRAGHEVRIDHRSHLERGLEIEPTEHMGVHASEIDRRGGSVSRTRIDVEAARRNEELIRRKPEQVLTLITGEKSVFDRHDVARALHRYIDEPQRFQNAFAAVMASSALVELRKETTSELARYTTREMLEIEHAMAASADRMGQHSGHGVNRHHVDQALRLQDEAIRAMTEGLGSRTVERSASASSTDKPLLMLPVGGLSDEQRLAIRHVTGPEQIAAVIGFAGAGKSTMLAAARDAWERQGYRVHGAALAGKAAEGLEESSGIASRTLASWEHRWQRDRGLLGKGDVLVIDEAGMVSSRQLGKFVAEVEARGAKLVLVGDHEQLQAIGAGSPFRVIAERIGAVELSDIRRQKQDWQCEASVAFATHRTGDGLSAYADRGHVRFAGDRDEARVALVRDYLADLETRGRGSRISLAHRRVDVAAINADIRAGLQEQGKLARGEEDQGSLGREVAYQTSIGQRCFAPDDRIVLLENNRDLGVKNGMLGTVVAVEPDAIQIRLDGAGPSRVRLVSIPVNSYQSFDHGYATTIHKSQGATVDRAFVLASGTMDRHLTYVAMTRHRDQVDLYVGRDEMKDVAALATSMGRSGAKESVLDYTDSFAARRGLSEGLGMPSQIFVGRQAHRADDRPAAHYGALGERVRSPADRLPSNVSGQIEVTGSAYREDAQLARIEPLVSAVTHYAIGVEEVAQEQARRHLPQDLDGVRSVASRVYADPENFVRLIAKEVQMKGFDAVGLAQAIAGTPQEFGQLRGRAGLLGDDVERKRARRAAVGLGMQVEHLSNSWERRVSDAYQSELWKREKQDVIEIPGLSPRSEAILKQLDSTERSERAKVLEKLVETPEGRKALDEARQVVAAVEKRFGRRDLRDIEPARLMAEAVADIARLRDVARMCLHADRAELTRRYELTRTQTKTLGLGM
ncbi:Ti-type conjugative transfer relaxase TraA [Rhizobium sp. SL42]|uniref:Ti-type conjugative transfer relaxase TraA n=1 Tax=Rhizobium sp. SL42 TaxID=2806346 RepID=UPI001F031C25|nr:Ti-type conjugative transfer relaxase TraA [Rhizobium sp. SL42]UJW76032.1 Ti-type conjugative transfer relaxase TraA [Rhizobium sp. SL42]